MTQHDTKKCWKAGAVTIAALVSASTIMTLKSIKSIDDLSNHSLQCFDHR